MQKLLLLVGLCVLVAHLEATGSRKLVCTFQRDSNFKMVSDMDPELCNHIIFKSVRPNDAMQIPSSGGPIQDHEDFKTAFPGATATTLLEVNLIGISSAIFTTLLRADFIASVVSVVNDENFNGVNILWMQTINKKEDRQGFTDLMQDLKLELGERLLTASVSGEPLVIKKSYEVSQLDGLVDFFNVMTADRDRTSPAGTFPKAISVMQKLVEKGASKEKLNMGIATYGFDTGNDANPRILPNYKVCAAESLPATVVIDSDATIDAKAHHIVAQDFGGAYVTSLQLDDFAGVCNDGPFPVIHRIKNIII